MALTLANAVTEVRSTINEESPEFWTDAEITNWIQEGTRVVSSKSLMAEDYQTIDPLVQNQLSYSSSDETWIADALEIYSALYNDGSNKYKGLIKVHPRQLGNLATGTAGVPKYYCLFNRQIFIWPLTSAAIAGTGTIDVLFSKETDDITALKDEFQHLPIIYSVAKCKHKDRAFSEAKSLFSQFYNELNFERTDKHDREVDAVEDFKVPRMGRGGSQRA